MNWISIVISTSSRTLCISILSCERSIHYFVLEIGIKAENVEMSSLKHYIMFRLFSIL